MSHMYCILDVEASGFGSKSYPIEVGFVLPDQTVYCGLITPCATWTHWDESAQTIHGIAREMLYQYGKPACDMATQLNLQLHSLTVYTDSWYHDYQWLSRLFDAVDMTPSFQLQDIARLLDDTAQSIWHTTKKAVVTELNIQRHRASSDAKVLQTTLHRVLTQTSQHHNG